MSDTRFLLIRLGSMGDVIHAIPAAAALRDTFPESVVDWVIDPKWTRLLDGNPTIDNVIALDRKNVRKMLTTIGHMRAAKYSCAVDFQALYKSAVVAYASRAPRRIGFQSSYAREGLAALFYTDRLNPRGAHKVDHNLTLVEAAGAKVSEPQFPIAIHVHDEEVAVAELARNSINEFFVLNPGGGWRSKCWPPARYGELHRKLVERYGWRGVVSIGPGEHSLAHELISAAGDPAPAAILLGIGPLMALMRRAKFVVSADTGPLHLASALGAPVVGLFGPTDPSRNGPYSPDDVVVRNLRTSVTTYRRGNSYAASMLSITVDEVLAAVDRRLKKAS